MRGCGVAASVPGGDVPKVATHACSSCVVDFSLCRTIPSNHAAVSLSRILIIGAWGCRVDAVAWSSLSLMLNMWLSQILRKE